MQAELDSNQIDFLKHQIKDDDFEVVSLAGDASSRRYYRLYSKDVSWVLMSWDPFTDNGEYPFLSVQRFFEKSGVRVPEVKSISGELGLILLEDLGDLTLERKFWENLDADEYLPLYRETLEELLKIHLLTQKGSDNVCTAFTVEFNTERLLWEMNYGLRHFVESLAQCPLDETQKKSITTMFTDISSKLASQSKVLCHRDFHSRNVMLHRGKPYIIDFQDARLGPVQYDLVSLLYDSYVDLNPDSREGLLNYYLDRARENWSSKFSMEEFQRTMGLQIIQRCFKACGSFASFYNDREDRRYLKYLRPTLDRVTETLKDFPEYKEFGDLLNSDCLQKMEIDSN